MATYLVTGGAGFVGSHLVEHLLAQGDMVWVIDDLSTGTLDNLAAVQDHPRLQVRTGSVTDEALVAEVTERVDAVYHLAASVGVKLIIDKLVDSIENNIRGTEVVLAAAHRYHKKVLLTSTSEVYGRAGNQPFRETDDLRMGETTKSRWSYACSKALDEYLAFAYHHQYGLPVTVVRLFNTVGERQTSQYGMVVPTFVKQALAGTPVTVYGTGRQTRCFCHVSDVVGALVMLMQHPNTIGEVYNIGSTEEISMTVLADVVRNVLGSNSTKVFIPYTEVFKVGFDDIDRRVPNVEKIKRLINFQPIVTLEEIIKKVASGAGVKEKASL